MDRISNLPDDVLRHILSFLPTKHAVATSILSTRWIRLWDLLQVLDFDNSIYLFPERKSVASDNLFLEFVDKVLSANKSPTIFKFTLRIHAWHGEYMSRINGWIQNVVLRNVVEIDLNVSVGKDEEEGLRIPGCSSLEILKIDCDDALYMPTSGCCFPNLRVLHVKLPLDETNNKELTRELIPTLPRLEELFFCGNIIYYPADVYINVTGAALKVLDFEFCYCYAEVMINAPNLQVLRVKDTSMSSFLVKNRPRLNEIKIDIGDYSDDYFLYTADEDVDRLRKLLQGIDNAESLSISGTIPLSLIFVRDTTLPVFHYFTKLELSVYIDSWVMLILWLQSFPNLKHLLLIMEEHMDHLGVQEDVDWSLSESVPPCLSSSITEIEITRVGTIKEEEVLMYLLDNAKVLDKFIVNSHVYIKDGVLQ